MTEIKPIAARPWGGSQSGSNLLSALRPDDLAELLPALRPWSAEVGTTLFHPGDGVDHVYFPCGPALVAFKVLLEDGREVETALIGREGAVGGIVSQGRLPAYARAEVQYPGEFLRLPVAALERAKQSSASLRNLFARYADCLLAQVFQAVACNAAHTVEQRTAKWLLSAIDRTGDSVVPLTQEQMAGLLGVGRSYVNRVVRAMKADGVLETRRGSLRISDMRALQSLSCGCDAALRRHFDEVLRGVYPTEPEEPRLESVA